MTGRAARARDDLRGVESASVRRSATDDPGGWRAAAAISSPQNFSVPGLLALQASGGNAAMASLLQGQAASALSRPVAQRDLLDRAEDLAGRAAGAVMGVVNQAEAVAGSALAELGRLAGCGPQLVVLAGGVSQEIQALLLRHLRDLTMPTAADAQALLPVVERAIADGVCACLTDEIVAAVALHVYLAGQPLAQSHLQHYLTGGGSPYLENIEDLFARNPTVRARVGAKIGQGSDAGRIRSGTLAGGADLPDGSPGPGDPAIAQSDWDDQDWRNAIGGVDQLDWTIISGPDAAGNVQVQIVLTDAYAWHPKEARISQCVHQALDNLRAHGAANYTSTGTGVVTLNLDAPDVAKTDPGAR